MSRLEDCMVLADEWLKSNAHFSVRCSPNLAEVAQSRASLIAAIVAYGDAQWNAAIEAAEDVIAKTVQGVEMAPAVRAVRRLKR